jgi:hypothetical protein
MVIATLSKVADWLIQHSWGMGLAVVVLGSIPPLFVTRSLWSKQRQNKGWLRAWVNLELVIVWAIPIVAALLMIV